MSLHRAALAAAFGLFLITGCKTPEPAPEASARVAAPEAPAQSVLLIGLDGLGPSLIRDWPSPNLKALAARGVQAEAMYPVMPSVTFVNFYALATGLYPENHGMVTNYPYDPPTGKIFDVATGPQEEMWWEGEPIWITAEKQGLPTAIMFWLGSEVAHDGVRPTVWTPYQHNKPYQDRVDEVLAWYDAPEAARPRFASIYFDRVDTAAHYTGPRSEETKEALAEVDGYVGQLVEGLKSRGLLDSINIIIVSDHGMAWIEQEQVIEVGQFIDLTKLTVPQFTGKYGGSAQTFIQIYGEGEALETAYEGLKTISEHIHVYRAGEMPAHYHMDHPTRGPALLAVADPGWTMRTAYVGGWSVPIPGNHGYDNYAPEMNATFIAAGPSFPDGMVTPPFENVNVYAMMACALGVAPAKTDGDPEVVEQVTGGRCPAPDK
ncbi:MAG: ectonucleotide pyrophosphatase/phosphodiesterase [Hyphomonas sp.]|uniref:ectonucleotide pyrophosphatase/phosphodiesterase n=1 Tax=Hyphomonas sp. TaxID=87 RepID=UPI0034A041C3